MARHIEDDHQEAVIEWSMYQKINLQGSPAHGKRINDYLTAIPNGGKRNAREGARMKAQGVTPHMPDLFFHLPLGGFSGLWLEMKRPKGIDYAAGKVTTGQKAKMNQLTAVGYMAIPVWGVDEAKKAIEDYLKYGPEKQSYE